MYTQDSLGKGSMLNVGMNKSEILNIMGDPSKSEIAGRNSTWHYCKTGKPSATGDCSLFVRRVNWATIRGSGLSPAPSLPVHQFFESL
jgi:outer membrane protein assembly factor BamE (lipoprotein component of BamABCDE complex)